MSCTHKVSYENDGSIGNWTRGQTGYILEKKVSKMSTFCLFPKTLNKAEFQKWTNQSAAGVYKAA
jgi:hypothetical protein